MAINFPLKEKKSLLFVGFKPLESLNLFIAFHRFLVLSYLCKEKYL